MKRFVLQSIIFFSFFLFVIAVIYVTEKTLITRNANFKVNKNIKYAIFGNSHPECAFNDSLISNFKNFSNSSEPYFYTYPKLKNLLIQNPQIDTIFIEYTNIQIDEFWENRIWENGYMSYVLPTYLFFLKKTDLLVLLKKNSRGFINCLSISLRLNFKKILGRKYNFSNKVGGYLYLVREELLKNKPTPPDGRKKSSQQKDEILCYNLRYNIEHLEAIVNFCEKNNIKVYFIRSPQHPLYDGMKNEQTLIALKQTKFSRIEFLDFNNFPLNDSEFGDLQHLNYRGAKIFSTWFDELLKDGLLSAPDKEQFVAQRIQVMSAK